MCLILVKRVGDELTKTDELTILAGHGALSAFKKQGHGSQHVAGRGLAPEVLTPVQGTCSRPAAASCRHEAEEKELSSELPSPKQLITELER